ncbi:MAG: biotin--[acetyl-CoA-carboxylase] ligase [Verrucomicrobiia bacterium]
MAVGILTALYRANGQFVAASEVRELLGSSNSVLEAEIAALHKLGYVIELHPHRGYRLLESPDRLMADDLEARLDSVEASLESVGANCIRDPEKSAAKQSRLQTAPTTTRPMDSSRLETAPTRSRVIGSEILVFEETASTNDVCEQLARSGGRDGLVVFAESQTKGRGRHGRTWVSPRGKGLWFSVLLRPQLSTPAAQRITVAASVAVARVVREIRGLDARIKWPNDVTVQGKKLAGVLVETSARFDKSSKKIGGTVPPEQCVILGIGVNVDCTREEFPTEVAAIATSLWLETGQTQNRPALAAAILRALDQWYWAALTEFDTVTDEWARLCTTLGKQIVVAVGTRRVEGCAQALNGDGALLVRKDNGQVECILGGDLMVEREWGVAEGPLAQAGGKYAAQ